MKLKKLIAVALTAVMTMSLTACGGGNTTGTTSGGAVDDGKTYNIGICQLVQHEALDAATKGFKDALTKKLGDKVKFDEQNKICIRKHFREPPAGVRRHVSMTDYPL